MAADRVIRWTTAGVPCSGVVAVVAVASYKHVYALVRMHGGAGWRAPASPLDCGRADLRRFDGDAGLGTPEGTGARTCEVASGTPGIARTLAVIVAHGLGHGVNVRVLRRDSSGA
jgi:hypothetical protein